MSSPPRIVAIALALICARAALAATPTLRARADGMLIATLPADLLAHRDVQRQLTSGLTTTFLITVTDTHDRKGGARVEVRYDPWDEVYLVTARGIDIVAQSARVTNGGRLAEWWRSAVLPVLPHAASIKSAQLSLEVLPFSIEEQQETQRWLTRSLGEAHRERSTDPSEVRGKAGSASVLDVLIGTSIQRRPILRYRWNVAVTR